MIEELKIKSFKSLDSMELKLGVINVFIGANGSGKSNLLEAIGVLSAAAAGRVDDEALLRRGVRPGVPNLYKSAFPAKPGTHLPHHIFLSASNNESLYEVNLFNPSKDPKPAWIFKTEHWRFQGRDIVNRGPNTKPRPKPDAGLAALKTFESVSENSKESLLDVLRDYAIYSPTTSTLRGITPEQQPRSPLGLSGGGLPSGVLSLLKARKQKHGKSIYEEFVKFRELIDWAKSTGAGPSSKMLLSDSASSSRQVVRFEDRYMVKGKNILSGADASEGALYVLFAAVLALDKKSPGLFAIDNADHGLNPRLARGLVKQLCNSVLSGDVPRQVLLTTHNPLVLDGLPLKDDRVRLFVVARANTGKTIVNRVEVTKELIESTEKEGSLSRLWVMGHLGGMPNV